MFQDVLFPNQKTSGSENQNQLSLRKQIRFQTHPAQIVQNATMVIFDFETTGLDSTYDRIIEVGAQKIKNKRVVDEFSTLISVTQELPSVVQKLTGITNQMLKGQPDISKVIPQFIQFIEGSILVAHNAAFDVGFLKAECYRQGIDLSWSAICSLKLARDLLPDLERKSLDALAAYYDLTFESRHRSVGDVKVTKDVLDNLLDNEGSHLKTWEQFKPYRVE